MYIKRSITETIEAGKNQVPILAIIGPRQSGKSTLVKKIFKDHIYLDMQDNALYEFANQDPKAFLETYKNKHGIIIDEAQYVPKLFSQLKVEVDKNPQPGYYILSGSQNFLLHEKISESLAGRVYFYRLLPLSIEELKYSNLLLASAPDQIYKGFYPRVYQPHVNVSDYYDNYIATYVERDIRMIKNIENVITFKKFIRLCAFRIGSTLNITELARDCAITVITAKNWLSVLESSFILFLLPSYQDHLPQRLIKSPKLYFYDVGLASHLMGLTTEMLLKHNGFRGSLFENMIIVDVIKNMYALNKHNNLTFFRDTNQNEIDLIIESGLDIIPIEIKNSHTIQPYFIKQLKRFKHHTVRVVDPYIIYGGDQDQVRTDVKVTSWKNAYELIKNI